MFLCRIHGLIKDAPDSLCQKIGGAVRVFFVDSLLGAGKNITMIELFQPIPYIPLVVSALCFYLENHASRPGWGNTDSFSYLPGQRKPI